LAAGNKVVATGRNTAKVGEAPGKSAELLVVKLELDITKSADAETAVN
jgi:NADP-dependent 3-hydroxy acid dehydrogenase YdfG